MTIKFRLDITHDEANMVAKWFNRWEKHMRLAARQKERIERFFQEKITQYQNNGGG